MPIQRINPDGMYRNPAFSQAILVPAGAQTAKALENVQRCLEAAGATLEQLVQVRIYLAGELRPGFGAWMAVGGDRPNPPTVTGIRVHGLANPDYLVEIEALAILE